MTVSSQSDAPAVTAMLGQRIHTLRFEDLSDDALTIARQCVLDWIAVTLAAQSEPLVQMLTQQVLAEGGHGQASLLGQDARVSVRQAALVNGAASHALDYDDVNMLMSGHPTVGILPAALSLAESIQASGQQLLTAFAAGYDAACRIGAMVAPSHYARGFHATGTVGTFGAAAACAHLLSLDHQQTQAALGIAAAQAAGLKSMFGTMCKPLHAGKASESGVLSACLAGRGFTSNEGSIECPQGFAATQSDGLVVAAAGPEVRPGEHLRENLFKYHASCYLTHAAIEALSRLRNTHQIEPGQVDRVELLQEEGVDSVCNISHPTTGLEIKFSLRMLAAMALLGVDTADGGNFTDERAADPVLISLHDRTHVVLQKNVPGTWCEARITLKDGRVLCCAYDSGVPEQDLDLQTARLISKAHALLDVRLGKKNVERIVETVLSLENMPDVAQLTRLIRVAD